MIFNKINMTNLLLKKYFIIFKKIKFILNLILIKKINFTISSHKYILIIINIFFL